MDELKKAKLRALNYLFKVIDQKWRSFIKDCKDDLELYWKSIDWPLRLETYSYIGNKYEERRNEFAVELRNIWIEWIELNKNGKIGNKGIFWPAQYEMVGNIDPNGNAERFPGNEFESHISMFRAKEILGIGGFDNYFNEAKKRIIEILFSEPRYFLFGNDIRIIWQVVRSTILKSELSDYLKVVALKLIEDKDFKELFFDSRQQSLTSSFSTGFQAMVIFFLCFGNLSNEMYELATNSASKLIDKQEMDGSFDNDILTTCLAVASIYFMKLDSSESVCNMAIEYILKSQNKEGNWDFLYSWDFGPGHSVEWNVLSTVVALETLDLITNDKPLPIWAEESKQHVISPEKKLIRIQTDKSLPVPKGITWSDVSICFISPESVEIRAGKPLGVKNFIEMGFKDRRSGKPDLIWQTLKIFARFNGEISWKDKGVDTRFHKNLKSYIKDIRRRLKFLFNIDNDPFNTYDRKSKTYSLKFSISIRESD